MRIWGDPVGRYLVPLLVLSYLYHLNLLDMMVNIHKSVSHHDRVSAAAFFVCFLTLTTQPTERNHSSLLKCEKPEIQICSLWFLRALPLLNVSFRTTEVSWAAEGAAG